MNAKNFCPVFLLVLLIGCASAGDSSKESVALDQIAAESPEWLRDPPLAVDMVYGVGGDAGPAKATLNAIEDIARQFKSQIGNIVVGESPADDEFKERLTLSLDEQIAEALVWEVESVGEYQASSGRIWVLARMSIDSMLDMIERVLISYSQELQMERGAIETLLDEVEERLSVERVREPEPEVTDQGFISVEGGHFQMGSDDGYPIEQPVHTVTVGGFSLAKYEVTVSMFREFVEDTGYQTSAEKGDGGWILAGAAWEQRADANWRNPYFPQTDSHPVTMVSWYDAVEYCNWRSEQEGRTPVYTISEEDVSWDRSADGYRLPTEAEWEFAARGGNSSREYQYSGSSDPDDSAWYKNNSGGETHPVGSQQANELGLHDMSGNVWEWCWDWMADYQSDDQSDPIGPPSGAARVMRGGSWTSLATYLRSGYRTGYFPGNSHAYNGFRVVAPLAQ